jgi:hypothetical protein
LVSVLGADDLGAAVGGVQRIRKDFSVVHIGEVHEVHGVHGVHPHQELRFCADYRKSIVRIGNKGWCGAG